MGKAKAVATLKAPRRGTVYIKVEGTLFKGGAWQHAAYLAANAQRFSDRIFKLAQIGLSMPVSLILGQGDPDLANRWMYAGLKGLSRDRIEVLTEEHLEKILKEGLRRDAVDFFLKLRAEGHPLVFLSGALDCFIRPLLQRLRLGEELHSNRLEYKNDLATGRLLEPVMGGYTGLQGLLASAERSGVELAKAYAYGSEHGDFFLLRAVGHPCAVNPDLRLLRVARELNWPILEWD